MVAVSRGERTNCTIREGGELVAQSVKEGRNGCIVRICWRMTKFGLK